MKQLELLAPARNADSAFAAIDHGADAIYIGASSFGARQSAGNSIEDIARTVEYAHRYGARVHATLNTLIYPKELAKAEAIAREVVATGVDALIVQDMAFAQMDLGVELHASTQMFNTSPERIKFLQDVGFKRVVLERGLTLEQIKTIRSAAPLIELEAFIHGAICVGMSGRCYLSQALSGRSGNRGECMQACRLNFDLVTASQRSLVKGKHLLSVKDMNLTEHIGSLIDAGVCSFKVEGRLKDLSYTKNIISHYRHIIDSEIAAREGFTRSSQGVSTIDFEPNPSKSFSRSESSYLLGGQQSNLASFDTPKAMGEMIGEVKTITKRGFTLNSSTPIKAGDGVCYIADSKLVGTNINAVDGREIIPNRVDKLRIGQPIFRNFDKAFNDKLEQCRAERKIDIRAELTIESTALKLNYRDDYGNYAECSIEGCFEQAKSRDRMLNIIREQIAKCGETEFKVVDIEIVGEPLFIASSLLSQLRRDTLALLRANRAQSLAPNTPFAHNAIACYPSKEIDALGNVTNSLAKEFYLQHGAQVVDRGVDITTSFEGIPLMQSRYCIRHEIGECLKRGSRLHEDLFIVRGKDRFRLEFDCQICQMNIYKA